MEIYDISQTLREGIAVWPGDPELRRRAVLRIREGESSNVSAFEMGTHTGTHIDAPLHLDDSGTDAANVPLQCFIGPVRVFAVAAGECIRSAELSTLDWHGVERALFKTPNGGASAESFNPSFVYLAEDAAEFLIKKNILLVGTDAPSVDSFASQDLPVHRMLLGNGVAILENAQLGRVPPGDYELSCLPLKLEGLDGSPVRAILIRK